LEAVRWPLWCRTFCPFGSICPSPLLRCRESA
jgi:hypothetical protein